MNDCGYNLVGESDPRFKSTLQNDLIMTSTDAMWFGCGLQILFSFENDLIRTQIFYENILYVVPKDSINNKFLLCLK